MVRRIALWSVPCAAPLRIKYENTYYHAVEAMTNEFGAVIDCMGFDPREQRKLANWESGDPTGGDPNTYPTTQGFTGHEMLDQTNLIHMNGQVYDPMIGRFLTIEGKVNRATQAGLDSLYFQAQNSFNMIVFQIDTTHYVFEGSGGFSISRGDQWDINQEFLFRSNANINVDENNVTFTRVTYTPCDDWEETIMVLGGFCDVTRSML